MAEDGVMRLVPVAGGSTGPNYILMIGDKYVGHFYVDASTGIDADAILEQMAEAWNSSRGCPT